MRQFHLFNFAALFAAALAWPTAGQAQLVPDTNMTDPTYIAVLQSFKVPGATGPCGFSNGNNYQLCTGSGIPLSYFATSASVNSRFADAFAQLADLQHSALQAQRGISAVSAMANIWMPSAPGRTSWAVNGATFQGEFGAGFSVAHRLPTNVPIAVTAAYGNGGGSAHVGRIGLMGEF
jgi:hypothetical protein